MEGKKSFIVYTSWKIWLDGLNDKQKGQWLSWVMNYTNDEWDNKEIEYPNDPVVKMACLMAQEQLKRDLADWKEQKQKRADAGRLGGIQRAVNQNQALSSKSKQCLEEVSNAKQNQANQAVNVNVNVNDNVNVNKKEMVKEKSKPASSRFTPPTLEEITAYCYERHNNVDSVRFYNFYQSKGWYVGKNKMKDWKAAVRTWEQEENKKGVEKVKNSPLDLENGGIESL